MAGQRACPSALSMARFMRSSERREDHGQEKRTDQAQALARKAVQEKRPFCSVLPFRRMVGFGAVERVVFEVEDEDCSSALCAGIVLSDLCEPIGRRTEPRLPGSGTPWCRHEEDGEMPGHK